MHNSTRFDAIQHLSTHFGAESTIWCQIRNFRFYDQIPSIVVKLHQFLSNFFAFQLWHNNSLYFFIINYYIFIQPLFFCKTLSNLTYPSVVYCVESEYQQFDRIRQQFDRENEMTIFTMSRVAFTMCFYIVVQIAPYTLYFSWIVYIKIHLLQWLSTNNQIHSGCELTII